MQSEEKKIKTFLRRKSAKNKSSHSDQVTQFLQRWNKCWKGEHLKMELSAKRLPWKIKMARYFSMARFYEKLMLCGVNTSGIKIVGANLKFWKILANCQNLIFIRQKSNLNERKKCVRCQHGKYFYSFHFVTC